MAQLKDIMTTLQTESVEGVELLAKKKNGDIVKVDGNTVAKASFSHVNAGGLIAYITIGSNQVISFAYRKSGVDDLAGIVVVTTSANAPYAHVFCSGNDSGYCPITIKNNSQHIYVVSNDEIGLSVINKTQDWKIELNGTYPANLNTIERATFNAALTKLKSYSEGSCLAYTPRDRGATYAFVFRYLTSPNDPSTSRAGYGIIDTLSIGNTNATLYSTEENGLPVKLVMDSSYIYFVLKKGCAVCAVTKGSSITESVNGSFPDFYSAADCQDCNVKNIEAVNKNFVFGSGGTYEYEGERIVLDRKPSFEFGNFCKTLKPASFNQTWQGLAISGNYIFRATHEGHIAVYMKTGDDESAQYSSIATFDLQSAGADNHCNNMNFSSIKYSENDEFPLLYLTAGNSGEEMICKVERIVRNGNVFSSTTIQTITLNQDDFDGMELVKYWGWPSWLIADDALYVFGVRYRSNGSEADKKAKNKYIITKFKIPSTATQNVTLTASDVIEQWTLPYDELPMQGGSIVGKYIFYLFGYGFAPTKSWIKVFDIEARHQVANINLYDKGWTIEPEDVCGVDNYIVLGSSSDWLRKLQFN